MSSRDYVLCGMLVLSMAVSIGSWRTANRVRREQLRRSEKVDRIDRIESLAISNASRLDGRSRFMVDVADQMQEKTADRFTGSAGRKAFEDLGKLNPGIKVPEVLIEDPMPAIEVPK